MKHLPAVQNAMQQVAETNSNGEKLIGYDAAKFLFDNKIVPVYGEFKASSYEELVKMGLIER